MVVARHIGSKRQKFQIDTYEKAMNFIWALRLNKAKDRLRYITVIYPELFNCTHQALADLVGLERETVSRVMKEIG